MSDNGSDNDDQIELRPPRLTWRERIDARRSVGVPLDPSVERLEEIPAYPTRYLPDRLLVTNPELLAEIQSLLQDAAAEFGWSIEPNATLGDSEAEGGTASRSTRRSLDPRRENTVPVDVHPDTLRRVRIFRDPKRGVDDQPVPPIDAWRVLQRARARLLRPETESGPPDAAPSGGPEPQVPAPGADRGRSAAGSTEPVREAPDAENALSPEAVDDLLNTLSNVGLDHVLHIGPYPRTNPYTRTNPYPRTNPNGPGADAYGEPGSGGRQVVDYIGTGPVPLHPGLARRPVVGMLDTGCGSHRWLDGVVTRVEDLPVEEQFGITDRDTDPEEWGDVLGPYDGYLDDASGHGTFVAGIVHQACPDAQIVSVRVADSDGTVIESELIEALKGLVDWVDGAKGRHLDVLNLSLNYFHETPIRSLFDRTLSDLLGQLRAKGCAVVCSSGNESTDRPAFPAALWNWNGAEFTLADAATMAPHVSVGALNPNGSMALFSNLGPWVRTYAPGAAVLSTFPPLNGDVQPGTRDTEWGVLRETIDPDDFSGGFAIWSGTSFAAPYVAGSLAASLASALAKAEAEATPEALVMTQQDSAGVGARVKVLHEAVLTAVSANRERGPRTA